MSEVSTVRQICISVQQYTAPQPVVNLLVNTEYVNKIAIFKSGVNKCYYRLD